jgi:hypothetical protein
MVFWRSITSHKLSRKGKTIMYFKTSIVILSIVILAVLTTSCDKINTNTNRNKTDTKKQNSNSFNSKYLFIKDESKYEKSFIEELIAYSAKQKEHLQLVDDVLTVKDQQYSLPSEIKVDKKYYFSAKEKERQVELVLIKHNLSSIEFDLKILNSYKTILKKHGVVTINMGFFLGSASEEDEETGVSYLATEYSHNDKNGYIYLRVGEDENKLLRASVQFKDFDDLPTMKLVKVKTIKSDTGKFAVKDK